MAPAFYFAVSYSAHIHSILVYRTLLSMWTVLYLYHTTSLHRVEGVDFHGLHRQWSHRLELVYTIYKGREQPWLWRCAAGIDCISLESSEIFLQPLYTVVCSRWVGTYKNFDRNEVWEWDLYHSTALVEAAKNLAPLIAKKPRQSI